MTLALLAPIAVLTQQTAADFIAARQDITAFYKAWGKARIEGDKETIDRSLTADFKVVLGKRTMTREEFMTNILQANPNNKLVRFDSSILTLSREGDDWVAVITEKMEMDNKSSDGKTTRFYALWVTRDGFHKEGNRWLAKYS